MARVRNLKRRLSEAQRQTKKVDFLQEWDAELFHAPFVDLWLKAGDGSTVVAHRSVLAGKSRVLRALLSSNLKEGFTHCVIETDSSFDALDSFVHFFYAAEVSPQRMERNWEELLDLAIRYGVKELESECVDHIRKNVVANFEFSSTGDEEEEETVGQDPEQLEETCKSVVYVSRIGKKYGLEAVMEAVDECIFFSIHRNRFFSSAAFLELMQEDPALARDILKGPPDPGVLGG